MQYTRLTHGAGVDDFGDCFLTLMAGSSCITHYAYTHWSCLLATVTEGYPGTTRTVKSIQPVHSGSCTPVFGDGRQVLG